MLSREGIVHILKETELSTIFATRDKAMLLIHIVATTKSDDAKSLKNIVVIDASALVTDDEIDMTVLGKQVGIRVLALSEIEKCGNSVLNARTINLKNIQVGAGTIASIYYTSGTTGSPKGVILTHKNMLSLMKSILVLMDLGRFEKIDSRDVYISYLPLAHVFERTMVTCLTYAGASIGFYQGDTQKLFDDIRELSPTIFPGVPRLYNRMYDKLCASLEARMTNIWFARLFSTAYEAKLSNLRTIGCVAHSFWDYVVFSGIRKKLGGHVRFMLTGAAPISEHVADFFRICFSCRVYEGYGLTETCSSLSVMDISDCAPDQVGSPVPGCQVKLVDVAEMNYFSTDKPCPRGEVCVRGPQLFVGYYKNPEETAKAMDADHWFHTGDIGCWDQSGRLMIVDRKKSIFKLAQGEYVAPEKVEGLLKRCSLVSQCFVYGSSSKAFLVAIVVPQRSQFMAWATKSLGFYHKNFRELCQDKEIRKAFLAVLDDHGRSNGLQGFENVRAVYLESDPSKFTVENGLLTPVFKLKRFAAKEMYEEIIEEMYKNLD
ncbi:Long chain acyl-CoA synthetase 7 peroxisomal [Entophlyctis luteolus]|nr:Long chain acyl-CoA synthetase 7 peroxisomal [Entophlyctis luteolus]